MFLNIYETVKKFANDNRFEFELALTTRRPRRVPRLHYAIQMNCQIMIDEQINDPVMAYNFIKLSLILWLLVKY